MNLSKALLGLLFTTFSLTAFTQEMLMDMGSNLMLKNWSEVERAYQNSPRAAGDTLQLPFFDDFSEPFSRLRTNVDLYPNQDLWIGKTVYQNNHMALNPISQGVLTFDGLNEFGLAYGFGFSLPFLADSLLSKPIKLQGAVDTVFLSFYYQAQGLGNAPEEEDLLVLEFKDSTETWSRVWEAEGYVLEDFKFNRVAIPVVDGSYLFDGFQFRFLNYASRAGNVDHWHIDYVELDQARSVADVAVNDLAFLGQNFYVDETRGIQFTSNSLLSEFNSMPWDHFKLSPIDHMTDSSFVAIRNNYTSEISSETFYVRIHDHLGNQLFENQDSKPVIFPEVICGSRHNECNDDPSDQLRSGLEGFVLPNSPEISYDSCYFVVDNVLLDVLDEEPANDRSVYVQEFYNYYAYDDGTAEAAYGLGELEDVGMVAVKYSIKKPDILRSIQLYLNPVEFDLSQVPVKLAVWYGNEQPEDTLWTSPEFITLNYTQQINYFYHYFLEREVPVSDNIWVGWIQQPATNLKFSIGFDKRTDRSQNVFYNLGTTWNQSSIPGSVMIRPTVGQAFDWVGVNEIPKTGQMAVYPNPSTGIFHLQTTRVEQLGQASIQVYDLSGRTVFSTFGYSDQLDLSHLNNGTYVLKVDTQNEGFTQRIIIHQ
jgi:hypothetical protein